MCKKKAEITKIIKCTPKKEKCLLKKKKIARIHKRKKLETEKIPYFEKLKTKNDSKKVSKLARKVKKQHY